MTSKETNTSGRSVADGPPPDGMAADPVVRVGKLGYVGFQTPDVARLTEYYTKVLGFAVVEESPRQVFLTTGADHHCIVIDQAETTAGRTFVGYEIGGSLDDADKQLRKAGLKGERRTDLGPGTPDVLVLTEPETGIPMHLYAAQDPSGVPPTYDVRPRKLGHVAAYTPSTDNMRAFYQEALGFRWSDTIGDFFVFLRCNADHHAANFMQSDNFQGLHHIAYEARDLYHLQTMLDNLSRHGYQLWWGPGRHVPGHNIFTYHNDPDGHHIELFTQMDIMTDEVNGYFEPRPWHEHFPMYPQTWEVDVAMVNAWGPKPPFLPKR